MIQHDIFCSFFSHLLANTTASFRLSKFVATRDSWSSSLQKQVSRIKPDFEYLSFSAGCDVSSLSGDVIVL